MRHTRRSMLRRTGAATGCLAALAGCLSTDSTDESDSSDSGSGSASFDPPSASTPIDDAHTWLPEPAALDTSGYAFVSVSRQSFREYEEHLAPRVADEFADDGQASGSVSPADTSAVHAITQDAFVLEGVDVSAYEAEYEAQGVEQSGTHQSYAIYEGVGGTAAALGDDTAVMALEGWLDDDVDDSDNLSILEAILDARAGSIPRYAEANEDAAALFDALGTAHALAGRTHELGTSLDGAVAEGNALHLGESESTVRAATVFAEGEADADAVSAWADDSSGFYGADVETTTVGRTVVVKATVPTSDVDSVPDDIPGPDVGESDSSRAQPQVQFDFQYESAGDGVGRLEITHTAGDQLVASELYVEGGPFADVSDADQTSSGRWQGSTGQGGTISAGNAVVVGVESGYDVEVVWRGESDSATLAAHTDPDS